MQRRRTYSTLYVPTLIDADGLRHIIPSKNSAAYCGAIGQQFFPKDHKANELCQRCVQKYMRQVLDIRMEDYGI